MQHALRGLGFAHTGQHRSKPVQLWEQGACRVILNSGDIRAQTPGTAVLSAFAVTSADPQQSRARADRLLAPALALSRGPQEVDLAAIAARDGTSVLLSRDDNDWRADFLPTGEQVTDGAGPTRTDHLGLAQPFDHFDEAGLFYQCVLGLIPSSAGEFAAPFGLMRSQAFTTEHRRIRLALTVALLRRGDWAPAVADPQHVAFATDDIFTAAEAIGRLGGATVQVSNNYYDDLVARFALPDAEVERLRPSNILYDRDPQGGELLHTYTPVFGGRVFFEILQRRGGHDCYGELNAPVRMAAYRHLRLSAR